MDDIDMGQAELSVAILVTNNAELQAQVKGLQRAAQEKEDYINRLLNEHIQLQAQVLKLRKKVERLCAELDGANGLLDEVEHLRKGWWGPSLTINCSSFCHALKGIRDKRKDGE